MKTLADRTLFIAGASSGMGKATALLAASKGASLFLLGRDSTRLANVVTEATVLGANKVTAIVANAENSSALQEALKEHQTELQNVDTLINTIGVNILQRAFSTLSESDWRNMIDTNLNAAFNLAKFVLPIFRAKQNGLLINVSSTAAKKPDASGAAYQATKSAVVAMTHAIQEEEWQNGIRTTAILPGMTDTPLLNKRPTPPTQAMRDKALQPEDIAATCLYVAELPARAHVSEITLQPAIR